SGCPSASAGPRRPTSNTTSATPTCSPTSRRSAWSRRPTAPCRASTTWVATSWPPRSTTSSDPGAPRGTGRPPLRGGLPFARSVGQAGYVQLDRPQRAGAGQVQRAAPRPAEGGVGDVGVHRDGGQLLALRRDDPHAA